MQCAEGYVHRAEKRACGSRSERDDMLPRAGGNASVSCFDANHMPDSSLCSQFAYGYCDAPQFAACASGCVTDDDCGSGRICACGHSESPTGGVCITANCATDADCGGNSLCASYEGGCMGGGFACQAVSDECSVGADCPPPSIGAGPSCAFADGHRYCSNCSVGRPFLVAAVQRVAPLSISPDWLSHELGPAQEQLSGQERAALAQHFCRLGQMEHASIAAFARFQLQLLALGAPAALVEACTRAMADETAHARICFELSSAYAGRPVGPGPLDISGSLTPTTLQAVVDLVIAEGCFGETSATLEALDAAEQATDPVLAASYRRIAADEERHAALAFQFVRWALQRGPDVTTARIAAALSNRAASPAVEKVVRPCLQALLQLEPAAA